MHGYTMPGKKRMKSGCRLTGVVTLSLGVIRGDEL